MAFEIRIMQKYDYEGAITLWRSLPGLALSGADKEDQIHRFLEMNPDTCFVAVDQGTVIGTILGGSDGRRGYIYHLAVAPASQRSGLGRELVARCLKALKNSGLQKCHIFVIADNEEGKRFWDRIEWVRREDILVMSKDL